MKDKHLLSLKDMNQSDELERLLDAGASSFKIEGRLKDVSYVKNVTAAYRQKLDAIFARDRNMCALLPALAVSTLNRSWTRASVVDLLIISCMVAVRIFFLSILRNHWERRWAQ